MQYSTDDVIHHRVCVAQPGNAVRCDAVIRLSRTICRSSSWTHRQPPTGGGSHIEIASTQVVSYLIRRDEATNVRTSGSNPERQICQSAAIAATHSPVTAQGETNRETRKRAGRWGWFWPKLIFLTGYTCRWSDWSDGLFEEWSTCLPTYGRCCIFPRGCHRPLPQQRQRQRQPQKLTLFSPRESTDDRA